MGWLNKLPDSRRSAPGLEWRILRKLPMAWLGGTLIPLFVVLGSHGFPPDGSSTEIARHLKTIDIMAIAAVITWWTAVFTVAIGCIVVMLMKGPAYVADRYDLEDSEHPRDD